MIFLSRWRGIIRDVPSSAPWPAKQERPAGGGRRSLLRRSSQSSVCKKSENNELPFNNFYTPFLYPYVLYVSFTPVKHKAPCRRLISFLTWFDWFRKYWRLPATKVIVRGPILSGVRNPTWRANLAPPCVGEEYSLTLYFFNEMINCTRKWKIMLEYKTGDRRAWECMVFIIK